MRQIFFDQSKHVLLPASETQVFFIVFDKITLLDLVGVYDPITRLRSMKYLPDLHWDICAMNAVIIAAGGVMTDLSGAPLRYNQTQPLIHGYLASNGVIHDDLVRRASNV